MTFKRLLILLLIPLLGGCRREPVPITEPRQITESPFQYPEELWDAGVQGKTVLRIFITAQGAVDSVRVERPSGHEAFDSAAVSGARDLKFEPARQGEEAISVWRSLPVEFNLAPVADSAAAAPETP